MNIPLDAITSQDDVAPVVLIGRDVKEQMHQWVENWATDPQHPADTPNQVWKEGTNYFQSLVGNNYTGLSQRQVRDLVYSSHRAAHGGDNIGKVEKLYSGTRQTAFLRQSVMFLDKNGMQRMMVFSLFELLCLLSAKKVSFKADTLDSFHFRAFIPILTLSFFVLQF